jgi:hypothetical protein
MTILRRTTHSLVVAVAKQIIDKETYLLLIGDEQNDK